MKYPSPEHLRLRGMSYAWGKPRRAPRALSALGRRNRAERQRLILIAEMKIIDADFDRQNAMSALQKLKSRCYTERRLATMIYPSAENAARYAQGSVYAQRRRAVLDAVESQATGGTGLC